MNKKSLERELNLYQESRRFEDYENLEFTIILVRPEHAANIGSIARIMANFDFENLTIINPIENIGNIYSYETQGFAMHGKDILLSAEIIEVPKQETYTDELKKLLELAYERLEEAGKDVQQTNDEAIEGTTEEATT